MFCRKNKKYYFAKKWGVPWHPWHPRCRRPCIWHELSKKSCFTLILWLLRGRGKAPLDHNWYVFVVFSYLLYFYRQWHLYKFLILGDLSTHLFGLVFPHPTSEKMRVAVHQTSPSPSVVLTWDFFRLPFLKNSLKMLLRYFLYMFVFTHPQAPFRQLGPLFLGWK